VDMDEEEDEDMSVVEEDHPLVLIVASYSMYIDFVPDRVLSMCTVTTWSMSLNISPTF